MVIRVYVRTVCANAHTYIIIAGDLVHMLWLFFTFEKSVSRVGLVQGKHSVGL